MRYKTLYKKNTHLFNNKDSFKCHHCGMQVLVDMIGTKHRNHCPYCLWSLHVDIRPGDRVALCNGLMQPISVFARDDGEISIIHRCTVCGTLKINRIAGDDDHIQLIFILKKSMNKLDNL
jgi:DNA-directed RNA polymerase subunit RPC12/RpoP